MLEEAFFSSDRGFLTSFAGLAMSLKGTGIPDMMKRVDEEYDDAVEAYEKRCEQRTVNQGKQWKDGGERCPCLVSVFGALLLVLFSLED